jgi:hypothetical protein
MLFVMRPFFARVALSLITLICPEVCRPQTVDWLDNFEWRRPLPQGNSLYDITEGTDRIIAVGAHNTIVASTNGTNWAVQRLTLSDYCSAIRFGNNKFVALLSVRPMVSSNGVDWSIGSPLPRSVGTLLFENGEFIAFGSGLLTSKEGIVWEDRTPTNSAGFTTAAFGNGVLVSVSSSWPQGIVRRSSTFVDWEQFSIPTSDQLMSIAFGNGLFVVLATDGHIDGDRYCNGSTVFTSTDGKNWVRSYTNNCSGFFRLAYGGGLFVAAGDGVVATSADAIHWSEHPAAVPSYPLNLCFVRNSFYVLGYGGALVKSTDGTNWISQTHHAGFYFSSIATGNGVFVVVGGNGTILRSNDGREWSEPSSPTTNFLRAVAHTGKKFVAVGERATVLASMDGDAWRKVPTQVKVDLRGIASGDGKIVAVGGDTNAVVLLSTNLDQWVTISLTNQVPFFTATYGGGLFVAAGGRYIETSTNGINWTLRGTAGGRYTGFAQSLFAKGTFVVAGSWEPGGSHVDPIIWYSTDGTAWKGANLPGGLQSNPLDFIGFANETFVATLMRGTVLTSSDGINWKQRAKPLGSEDSITVISDGRTVIGMGRAGTILQFLPYLYVDAPQMQPKWFGLHAHTPNGTVYRFQTSSNLVDWNDRPSAAYQGDVTFIDVDRNVPARFYRLISP